MISGQTIPQNHRHNAPFVRPHSNGLIDLFHEEYSRDGRKIIRRACIPNMMLGVRAHGGKWIPVLLFHIAVEALERWCGIGNTMNVCSTSLVLVLSCGVNLGVELAPYGM